MHAFNAAGNVSIPSWNYAEYVTGDGRESTYFELIKYVCKVFHVDLKAHEISVKSLTKRFLHVLWTIRYYQGKIDKIFIQRPIMAGRKRG